MGEPAFAYGRMVAVVVNIAGILDAPAAAVPDRAALIVIDDVCTYGELASATERAAVVLAEHGVVARSRVALVDWAGVPAVAATLALAHLGGAAAPMNPMLTARELGALAQVAGCAPVGIAGSGMAEKVRSALGGTAPVLLAEPDGVRDERATATRPMPPRTGGGDDEALVLFTSGTTGRPKPVPITHAALSRRIADYRLPFSAARPPAVSMMCVPAFHVGGLLGLILNLYSGDTTVVQPRFDAGQWLDLVERHRVGSAFVVPTMLKRILEHPRMAASDLSALTAIAYGAAAAPLDLIRHAMEVLPHVRFTNVFGQTETLGAYTTLSPADHRDPRRAGSVGRPLPGVSVRLVDPTNGQDVDPAETDGVGELWVKSPHIVGSGWLRTGDLARRDADGYLYPTGRISDIINRGGEKFSPAEVADVVRTHPDVLDVGVAGIADPDLGERVGVAIVARPGSEPLTTDAVRAWCRPHLASYKLPEMVVVAEALPYNEVGKLSRRAIADLVVGKDGGRP